MAENVAMRTETYYKLALLVTCYANVGRAEISLLVGSARILLH